MKKLYAYLALYAILALILNNYYDLYTYNSYQRTNAALSLADTIKTGNYTLQHIKDYHTHYQIAAGLVDWPPLQITLLTITYLVLPPKTGTTLICLTITLLTLYYFYKITKKYTTPNNALTYTIILSTWPYFITQTTTAMLDNGLLLFTLATTHYYLQWLETQQQKHITYTAISLAIGIYWKTQIILILPAMLLTYLLTHYHHKHAWKATKQWLAFAAITLLILTPLITAAYILETKKLAKPSERTIGAINLLGGKQHLPGYISWLDMESINIQPTQVQLINNRYQISIPQKTILFLTLMILPLILFTLALTKATYNKTNTLLALFIITNTLFYMLYGGLPRYLTTLFAIITLFLAINIKNHLPAIILISHNILTTTLLILLIHNGYHSMAQQNDYHNTAKYLLEHTNGTFTIITTNMHPLAYELIQQDKQRRAYIYLLSDNQTQFENSLKANYTKPYPEYNLPPPKYVVVHQGRQTGLLPGTRNYTIQKYFTKQATIHSKLPNADTYIYDLDDLR